MGWLRAGVYIALLAGTGVALAPVNDSDGKVARFERASNGGWSLVLGHDPAHLVPARWLAGRDGEVIRADLVMEEVSPGSTRYRLADGLEAGLFRGVWVWCVKSTTNLARLQLEAVD
ncbi:MAG: hypothetical protein AAF713_18805 [Pseudomonadota bacterium]